MPMPPWAISPSSSYRPAVTAAGGAARGGASPGGWVGTPAAAVPSPPGAGSLPCVAITRLRGSFAGPSSGTRGVLLVQLRPALRGEDLLALVRLADVQRRVALAEPVDRRQAA